MATNKQTRNMNTSRSILHQQCIHLKCLHSIVILLAAILSAVSVSAIPWVSRHGLTSAEYEAEFKKWTGKPHNYRLISVAGYEKSGQARYAAIWEKREGPGWVTHHGMTKAQYESAAKKYAAENKYPVFLSGFGVGNQSYYNAIWESAPGSDVISQAGLSWPVYLALNSIQIAQGYELVHLWTWNAGSSELFAAIWRKVDPADYQVRLRRTSSEYQVEFDQLAAKGYQLRVVSAAVIGGNPLYSSVWKKPGDGSGWYSYHGFSATNYQAENWNAYYQGYRPVLASVFTPGSGERFNVILRRNGGMSTANLEIINETIADYMESNDVPGLSLAISRDGHLLYSKGFGLADQEADERVHPHHRFRIASVSKPITAAAILKLRDLCGLDLDQTVFGPGALLGETYGTPPYSNWEQAITVRQLLHHTTGWTTDGIWQVPSSDDPKDAINWQLNNSNGQPFSVPGTSYTYMNIGYCVAGRVIERLSGRPYEKFVQDELLAPSCITQMEIGGRKLSDRKPNEVVYYQPGGSPYSLSPSRMDAHGGWIARPIDLLLLMRRMDGDPDMADLLQAGSITEMLTGSAPRTDYGLGNWIRSTWWGHNGCMDGTIAFLVHRNDGFAFAVTANTRPLEEGQDSCAWTLRSVINQLITGLEDAGAWPDLDLFPCSIPAGDPPPGLAKAKDLYVNGSSKCLLFRNGNKQCSLLGGPYLAVNEALAANPCAGHRLFIRAGSYKESVLFDRYMTVRSYDGAAVIGK
jgi:CubicO group peptidase (beta-lactamase class C family)